MAGIYIHIPFCKQACHYCDFHFSTNKSRFEEMLRQIAHEAELRKEFLQGETIQTIYLGGGTPSLAEPNWLKEIFDTIKGNFILDLQEVTLEANPDDLTEAKLDQWQKLGIDRLSLGIQSFQDEVLTFYNRAHSAEESIQAIQRARNAGFKKFSMDLIYGFPHADHSIWEKDLSLAIAQNPGHLSCYALTVEPKTALGNWTEKGKFQPAEEDFVAEQFEMLQIKTERAGYLQYEISNFALPGQESVHNSSYWKGEPYLGLGPGAHSFDGKNRGFNPSNNALYLKSIQNERIIYTEDPMDEIDRLNEYLLTALRTSWGADFDLIKSTYGKDLKAEKRSHLEKLESEGWLVWNGNRLSLSKSGKLLADSIAQSLFY